ncbi:hypothetical protein MIND_00858400 [Mycena indigotica]|uniref:Uncharacterized protein n=1 Tax=Mycena indigotica TaxID=2126181 RepID=A0A8H6W119_9AGAR|nr:uncharacterized protein MIND_00858400 [Mycena indigotica]KAF7299101.1 hypothetical protein MIND_00858400 [Mycena indigotica]
MLIDYEFEGCVLGVEKTDNKTVVGYPSNAKNIAYVVRPAAERKHDPPKPQVTLEWKQLLPESRVAVWQDIDPKRIRKLKKEVFVPTSLEFQERQREECWYGTEEDADYRYFRSITKVNNSAQTSDLYDCNAWRIQAKFRGDGYRDIRPKDISREVYIDAWKSLGIWLYSRTDAYPISQIFFSFQGLPSKSKGQFRSKIWIGLYDRLER